MARLLTNTNPNLIQKHQQKDAVGCLLDLCKGTLELAQYEATLALTNLASVVDEDLCAFLVAKKAIHTITYLQFSDNTLIQAAATECLANMMGNPDVAEYVAGSDKLKLWVHFAETYDAEDTRLASAAAGGLNTLARMDGWQYKDQTDEDDGIMRTAQRMLDAQIVRAMLEIMDQSHDGGLEHRAVSCLVALSECQDDAVKGMALKEIVGRSGKAILARLRGGGAGAAVQTRHPSKRTPGPSTNPNPDPNANANPLTLTLTLTLTLNPKP